MFVSIGESTFKHQHRLPTLLHNLLASAQLMILEKLQDPMFIAPPPLMDDESKV